MILVSACMLGVRCRFDDDVRPNKCVMELARTGGVAPVCPEQLGGMSTPRPPADLSGGDGRAVIEGLARVVAHDGTDVTAAFLKGAQETVMLARRCGVRRAILKDRSPSCGVNRVYVDGEIVEGMGVTAAMLEIGGVDVVAGEEYV